MCCCWRNGHFLLYLSLSCVMWRNGCALAATQQNVTLMSKVLLNRYSPQIASVHVIPSSDDIQWKFKRQKLKICLKRSPFDLRPASQIILLSNAFKTGTLQKALSCCKQESQDEKQYWLPMTLISFQHSVIQEENMSWRTLLIASPLLYVMLLLCNSLSPATKPITAPKEKPPKPCVGE